MTATLPDEAISGSCLLPVTLGLQDSLYIGNELYADSTSTVQGGKVPSKGCNTAQSAYYMSNCAI